MSIQQMQQHLIDQINTIHDKNILLMLEEELSYYLENKADLTEILTSDEIQELTMLAKEPIGENTVSFSEFNKIMDQWRMK